MRKYSCWNYFKIIFPIALGTPLFVLCVRPLIYISTVWASRLNVWLVAGLAISYFGFVFLGFHYVKLELTRVSRLVSFP